MTNIIAKTIYPEKEKVCEDILLYFRGNSQIDFGTDRLIFLEESTTSFLTYFNAISYGKLKKYAAISKLQFRFFAKGNIKVLIKYAKVLMSQDRNEYDDVYWALLESNFSVGIIKEELCSSINEREYILDFDIESLEGEGIVYVELGGEKGASFRGGEYLALEEAKRQSKIGIVFCTYRREEYVKSNVSRINLLKKEDADLAAKIGVFVIDNGKTLHQEELEGAMLFPNPNTGGSGGFTRGIKEVCARSEYTHFLLMDDDIKFETEILRRIIFWTENAIDAERLTIGSSMLLAEKPYFQHEMGARWMGKFISANKFGYNLRHAQDLVKNEYELPTQYTAWWCCCMSVSTLKRIGLPLQLFIKCDDIEYSLRAKNEILVTNGIGVWHESFNSKYSSELEYYVKRNEAIINCLHKDEHGPIQEIKKMIRGIARQLIYHRYLPIRQIFLAYDDFLKGPKYFLNIDAEMKHKQLRAGMIKQYSKDELKDLGFDIEGRTFYKTARNKPKYRTLVMTLNGYLIPKCRYPKEEKDSFRLIEMNESRPKSMYKANTVVQYNRISKKGFVTHIKKSELFYAGWGIFVRSIKLLFKYRYLAKGYKKLIEIKD